MEINNYKVFLEVAKYNNITKAADALGYTQSGISHALKRMEDDFQLKLFERGRAGAQLTEPGKLLLPYVRQVVQSQGSLEQVVASINDLHQGTVNIATFSSISRQWLPDIIYQFKRDYPSIEIHFKEGGIQNVSEMLASREVDMAFTSKDENIECDWDYLVDDTFVAILPLDYPFDGDVFPLEEFTGKTFIISSYGVDYDLHRILDEYNIHPNIEYSAQDDMTILAMVEKNLGLSILPELVIRKYSHGIKAVPLKPTLKRRLGIAYPKGDILSPVAKTFMEYSKKIIRQEQIYIEK